MANPLDTIVLFTFFRFLSSVLRRAFNVASETETFRRFLTIGSSIRFTFPILLLPSSYPGALPQSTPTIEANPLDTVNATSSATPTLHGISTLNASTTGNATHATPVHGWDSTSLISNLQKRLATQGIWNTHSLEPIFTWNSYEWVNSTRDAFAHQNAWFIDGWCLWAACAVIVVGAIVILMTIMKGNRDANAVNVDSRPALIEGFDACSGRFNEEFRQRILLPFLFTESHDPPADATLSGISCVPARNLRTGRARSASLPTLPVRSSLAETLRAACSQPQLHATSDATASDVKRSRCNPALASTSASSASTSSLGASETLSNPDDDRRQDSRKELLRLAVMLFFVVYNQAQQDHEQSNRSDDVASRGSSSLSTDNIDDTIGNDLTKPSDPSGKATATTTEDDVALKIRFELVSSCPSSALATEAAPQSVTAPHTATEEASEPAQEPDMAISSNDARSTFLLSAAEVASLQDRLINERMLHCYFEDLSYLEGPEPGLETVVCRVRLCLDSTGGPFWVRLPLWLLPPGGSRLARVFPFRSRELQCEMQLLDDPDQMQFRGYQPGDLRLTPNMVQNLLNRLRATMMSRRQALTVANGSSIAQGSNDVNEETPPQDNHETNGPSSSQLLIMADGEWSPSDSGSANAAVASQDNGSADVNISSQNGLTSDDTPLQDVSGDGDERTSSQVGSSFSDVSSSDELDKFLEDARSSATESDGKDTNGSSIALQLPTTLQLSQVINEIHAPVTLLSSIFDDSFLEIKRPSSAPGSLSFTFEDTSFHSNALPSEIELTESSSESDEPPESPTTRDPFTTPPQTPAAAMPLNVNAKPFTPSRNLNIRSPLHQPPTTQDQLQFTPAQSAADIPQPQYNSPSNTKVIYASSPMTSNIPGAYPHSGTPLLASPIPLGDSPSAHNGNTGPWCPNLPFSPLRAPQVPGPQAYGYQRYQSIWRYPYYGMPPLGSPIPANGSPSAHVNTSPWRSNMSYSPGPVAQTPASHVYRGFQWQNNLPSFTFYVGSHTPSTPQRANGASVPSDFVGFVNPKLTAGSYAASVATPAGSDVSSSSPEAAGSPEVTFGRRPQKIKSTPPPAFRGHYMGKDAKFQHYSTAPDYAATPRNWQGDRPDPYCRR